MAVSILAGFSTGEGALHAPGIEESFFDRRMDAEVAHELYEQARSGCPLCLSNSPWLPCDHRLRRHEDGQVGEGLVAAEQDKFWYFDEKSPEVLGQPEFTIQDGEIVAQKCSWEWVLKIQEIGCCGVVPLSQGLYNLFFPMDCQDRLADALAG